MRKVQLTLNGFALLAVYAVASSALNAPPEGVSSGASFLERLGTPFLEITPLAAGVLAAAAISFSVAILAAPTPDQVGPSISWSQLIQVAFVVNTAVVAGIAAALFLGHTFPRQPHAVGVLFLTGVFEAALGLVLAATHFFLKRPRLVFLPTLGVHLLSMAALGAAYLLGSGSTP
jgi:hypothetical protein